MPSSPVIYVIGGPNGAGKTTFAREFLPAARVVEFLNADLLAAGLSPLQPGTMAVRSARLLLGRWRELLALRRDFAFESTLSGRSYATCCAKPAPPVTKCACATCGCRVLPCRCAGCASACARAAMTCRKPICGGAFCRVYEIFSRCIFPWRMKPCCLTRRPVRRSWSPGGMAGPPCGLNPNFMTTSKNKSKPAVKSRGAQTPFVARAQRAIRKAQQTAARENARFGLPMIVQAAQ